MGRLVSTGAHEPGHRTQLVYGSSDSEPTCHLTCECGWATELQAFDKPWGVLEVQRRYSNHISAFPATARININGGTTMRTLHDLPAATWSSTKHRRLPLLAPPFRILSPDVNRVWASGFDAASWRTDRLDDRWVLDTTDISYSPHLAPSDALVWVGDGVSENTGESGWCLWPPSQIVEVDHDADQSVTRVRSLRDAWLAEIDLGDAPWDPTDTTWRSLGECHDPVNIPRGVLQWWGLGVWCPACGDLGRPTSYGMAPAPMEYPEGYVQEWFEYAAAIGSCVVFPHGAMECARCGHVWSQQVIAEPPHWPKDPYVDVAEVVVDDPSSLMSLYNVTTEQDLLEAIVENDEPDTYAHVRAAGLEVQAGQNAIWLDYPMTIAEIRAAIDDLEDQQQAEMQED